MSLATTDKFSSSRLRALKRLYEKAESPDKEKIGELFEIFTVLANTEELADQMSEIMDE